MHDISLIANKLGALGAVIDAALSDAFDNLSASAAAALLTLHYHAPLTTTALSRIVRLSQPATTRLVEGLTSSGWVARSPGTGKGEINLALTAKGRRKAERIQQQRIAALATLLSGLSNGQKQQLSALLDHVVEPVVTDRASARHLCRFCDHDICDGALCLIGCAATRVEQKGNRP